MDVGLHAISSTMRRDVNGALMFQFHASARRTDVTRFMVRQTSSQPGMMFESLFQRYHNVIDSSGTRVRNKGR
jgi:hypothetical protein